MRDFGPVPLICARSTPISHASFLTEGPACAFANPSSLKIGGGRELAGTGTEGGAAAAAAGAGATGSCRAGAAASTGAGAGVALGSAASVSERTVTRMSPGDTLLDVVT